LTPGVGVKIGVKDWKNLYRNLLGPGEPIVHPAASLRVPEVFHVKAAHTSVSGTPLATEVNPA